MTRLQRDTLARMDAAALADLPPSVIRLAELLERTAGLKEHPLSELPEHLKSPDVLHVAQREGLVRIVVQWAGAIATATRILGYTMSWIDYRQAGYVEDLNSAMKMDPVRGDPKRRLHIRLTRDALNAVIERRVRLQEQPMPADAVPCAFVTRKYHITRKTLYEAITEGRLTGYRLPGAAKNSPYYVSENEVGRYWSKRG